MLVLMKTSYAETFGGKMQKSFSSSFKIRHEFELELKRRKFLSVGIINFLISPLVPVFYKFQYSRNSWHILSNLQSYCKSGTSVSLFCEWAFSDNFGTGDHNIRIKFVHRMPWVIKKNWNISKER